MTRFIVICAKSWSAQSRKVQSLIFLIGCFEAYSHKAKAKKNQTTIKQESPPA